MKGAKDLRMELKIKGRSRGSKEGAEDQRKEKGDQICRGSNEQRLSIWF